MIFRNLYFSWRYLRHNPLFTLINMVGLVIGITSALFIFIYVSSETSYDRFHKDYPDIYRVLGIDSALGVSSNNVGITMPPLGPAMEQTIPGVLKTVRIRSQSSTFVTVGDRKFDVNKVAFTDDAFFEVFGFSLLERRSGALLSRPHAGVLTRAFARKVFGDEPALGKVLIFNNQSIEVVGILADNRPDSHMQFELLLGLNYLSPDEQGAKQVQAQLDAWGFIGMVTYAKLAPGTSELAVEASLKTLLAERSLMKTFSATLQPLREAHLGSSDILFDDFNQNKGDQQKVVMLASVAVFLLLIAACNFMNLSTARSSLRAKEVGVRKSAGATRAQLIRQYLQESLLLVFAAAALGLVLLWQLAPLISLPLAQGYVSYLLSHGRVLAGALVGLVALGLLGGSYPAFVLSSFSPAIVLKGKFANSARGAWLRRLLVVMQFALSIAIIIGMLVVYRQIEFMKNSNPGFERDGIVNITLGDQALFKNYDALRNRLLQIPQVRSVAGSSNMPGSTFSRNGIKPMGGSSNDNFIVSALAIDENYLDTLSMKLVAGRNYSRDTPGDVTTSIILNESAAKALGWDDAVGKSIQASPGTRTVIGVVKDFHFADMRHKIEPVMMLYQNAGTRLLSIRIDRTAPREALAGIAAAWKEINPDYPFSYTFFTDEYNKLFKGDEAFSAMLIQFTFIAIIIACLGLYGLASFSAEQKTKEIGIRKVLGAGTGSLLKVVLQEYVVLLVVANLLAWGAAWFVMQRWLSGFVYRTELPLSSFVLATAGTTLLALLTVGREILKVIRSKPVDALRYE